MSMFCFGGFAGAEDMMSKQSLVARNQVGGVLQNHKTARIMAVCLSSEDMLPCCAWNHYE